ncbi:MAG TPA: glycosyltransferase [Chitinophagales bacterium]|nr:glycosyltransferase [Chitinophagales bacterium]
MPRILRIINRLNLGGPTFNAAYLTKYMSPEYETMLVAGMIDGSEASSEFVLEEMGLKPVYIPEMYREIDWMKDRSAYFRLKKIIRDFKPDIVHTHAAKAGALGRMAAYACHVPVILHTFHGNVFHSYFSKWKTNVFINVERQLAKRSTRIIAISEKQKRELSEQFRICPAEKIEIIPLGFDLRKFSEDVEAKRKKFRDHYLVADDEIVISIVGRLVPVKNHKLFLHALKNVISQTQKKVRAFIVGDGEDRLAIESLSRSLQIDFADFLHEKKKATLTFTSWLKDVDEVYAGSEIVALTSLNEGTPVSIIEALAAGKPVVTTDVGGISDIMVNEKNGFIVNSNAQDAFTDALLKLVEDTALRGAMENFHGANTSERFSYVRLVNDMSVLYSHLLQTR